MSTLDTDFDLGADAVLTLNAGSSSLKFALFCDGNDKPLYNGLVDRIGPDAHIRIHDHQGRDVPAVQGGLESHEDAFQRIIEVLGLNRDRRQLSAVGHRVVHGGQHYAMPTLIHAHVLADLAKLIPFAPLHQPHNLRGIALASEAFPGVAQVACFDTAFHRSHPWVNDTFALPRALYDEGVRRYGFHGLSYEFVLAAFQQRFPASAQGKLVIAHLGNGASMCAISEGRSVASTMGFSALDGLPMGTRCGQLDPGVLLYLMDQKSMTASEISDLLYKHSGLLGLSGLSNDMRTLQASPDQAAAEAIDYFVFRCQRELGAMAAALGGLDALVFCGGIGENASAIRARICSRLAWMGVEIDAAANEHGESVISSNSSRALVLVIPTNEELVIASAARSLSQGLVS